MVTQKEAEQYYLKMYDEKSVYVWGFNSGTIITQESIQKAYNTYKSKTYGKSYYSNKLIEGEGRNGSDCSGAHYPLSGYDTTAQGYYNRCTDKNKIKTLPRNKVVLLFSGNSTSGISHTGVWLPSLQKVFHMKSSADNCVIEPLENSKFRNGWWGYADFINDYSTYSFSNTFTYESWARDIQNVLNYTYNAKLVVDGIVGAKTLAALPTVKRGNKGSIVTLLQKAIEALDYSVGEIDGIFGKDTFAGVVGVQKSNGLTPDGIVGPKTWDKINKLLKARY